MDSAPTPVTSSVRPPRPKKKKKLKTIFTKQFYLWHWVSSAVCLASMLLFAVTGITLNHAEDIKVKPKVTNEKLELSESQLASLAGLEYEENTPLPKELAKDLSKKLGTPVAGKEAEWSEYEIYLTLARPGQDAWLLIDRETGEVEYEKTYRGTVSFLNDLHQGRNTGTAWSWYLDIFSVACVIFTLTGLALLWVHCKRRPSTWPLVAGGVVLPIVLILFFIH
ncbi:PepSY-associated TM helix domain-containing protein [Roseibacillus ishigakijimensis]|uniref:PepSY-associated TM helix domain-containing protein n=1 Tax=Roseibacillus ishigakijimensis TaxID=454146 RepID=UPI0036340A63